MSENTVSNEASKESFISNIAGKYLTFKLKDEYYGIQIIKVQEIIGIMPVTRVPKTPKFIRGVINLRGKVIPVIELRRKFGMESIRDNEATCIIVVQISDSSESFIIGLIVDEVSEVLEIPSDQIESSPDIGNSNRQNFIMGMGKVANKVIMLINVDGIVLSEEISKIQK
ncbi:MAG: hypothetical protein ACD_79C00670G0002 [uncultured bacterium]|nr:MAG: hypothetical protein ACD_79C00670G0002 [uncultured bacterium]